MFKVPNMNISIDKIHEDGDLNWYISVHKKTALCVSFSQPENPTVNTMKDAGFQAPSLAMEVDYRNLQRREVEDMRNFTTDNVLET